MEPRAPISSDFRKLGLCNKNLGYKVIGCISRKVFFINLNELSSVWPPAHKIVHIIDVDFDCLIILN